MRDITKQMVKIYRIRQFDFMGYDIKQKESLSYHHLIIPHRDCHDLGLGEGYYIWNGAVLVQDTAHDYLHIIENKDRELFELITKEMIDENYKGKLDIDNLKRIRDYLLYFEKEHDHDKTTKGKLVIKRKYVEQRHKF